MSDQTKRAAGATRRRRILSAALLLLGEAAMMTAQVAKQERFGMNSPGNDNQQFALKVTHWLSRKL